jgi:hypothetical protein
MKLPANQAKEGSVLLRISLRLLSPMCQIAARNTMVRDHCSQIKYIFITRLRHKTRPQNFCHSSNNDGNTPLPYFLYHSPCPFLNVNKTKYYTALATKCRGEIVTFSNPAPDTRIPCLVDLSMGTFSVKAHFKAIFSFSPSIGRHCNSNTSFKQLTHISHLVLRNNAFINPRNTCLK